MTFPLQPSLQNPMVDQFTLPLFFTFQRDPTSQDLYNPGTRIFNSKTGVIWETIGGGTWEQGGEPYATTSAPGIVQLSSSIAGDATSTTLVPSVKEIKDYVDATAIAGAPISQQTVFGIVKLSSDSNAVAGTANNPGVTAFVVQPSNLAAVFAAPPAIGGTTPAAAVFTTLGATTVAFTVGGSWLSGGTAIQIGTDASNDNVSVGSAGTRTVLLGSHTSTSTTTVDSGTGGLNLGTTGAKTVTIGNVTSTTAVNVNTGTGGMLVTTTGAGNFAVNSATDAVIDAGGVVELNSSGGIITIGNDAVNQSINIGTGGTRTITIGTTTSSTIAQLVGSGGWSVDGITTSTYAIGPSTTTGTIVIGGTAMTGAGVITLGSSSATSTVKIASGAGASTITIAEGTAGANTVSVLNGAIAATGVVNIMNGATAASATVNILSGVGTASTAALHMGDNPRITAISLGNVAPVAARTTTMFGGASAQNDSVLVLGGACTAGTQKLEVLNGALNGSTNQINLLSGTIASGTQTFNLFNGNASGGTLVANIFGSTAATTAGTLNLNTGAAAHILNVGSSSAGNMTFTQASGSTFAIVGTGGTINIGADAANTIGIGSGAFASAITIGSVSSTATLALKGGSGAGAIALSTGVTGQVTIGLAATTGLITIGQSTAGQSISIGSAANTGTNVISIANGAVASGTTTVNIMSGNSGGGTLAVNIAGDVAATTATTIKIGTGAVANLITIGSLTGAAALTLRSGTGGISLATGATTAGLVSVTPNTASTAAATSTVTLNSRVLCTTWTGFTTASGATQAFTIVSSQILVTSAIIVTVANLNVSTNNAQMSLVGVTQSAGQIIVNTKNNGAGALGGGDNVLITVWIMS